jgi:undecaprenyl-diphosphatase
MAWHRLRTFFGRRFAPGEYLGLHLTLGLLLTLATLVLFAAITRSIRQDQGELNRFDHRLAQGFEEHAQDHPRLLQLFRAVTQLGGVTAMVTVTLAGSLILLARRRRLLAIVWMVAALGGGLFTMEFKAHIDRDRPGNPDDAVVERNKSYFSGHSMGSVVGYGMLAYILLLRLRRRWLRAAAVAGLALLVLLIGFSRLYLRAHYFTDVLGGFCIGAVWLSVCISGLEVVRRRRQARPPSAAGVLSGEKPSPLAGPHIHQKGDGRVPDGATALSERQPPSP